MSGNLSDLLRVALSGPRGGGWVELRTCLLTRCYFGCAMRCRHYRVPFFGEEVNDTAIIANGNSPAIMGAELNYAAQHGIQFWSFCSYPIGCTDMHPPASDCKNIQCCADNVGLSYAWNLYLNHPENHKVGARGLSLTPSFAPVYPHMSLQERVDSFSH